MALCTAGQHLADRVLQQPQSCRKAIVLLLGISKDRRGLCLGCFEQTVGLCPNLGNCGLALGGCI